LTDAIAECIEDRRDSRYVRHAQCEPIRQRVYQIATGCEDCNDSNSLRSDPALKTAVGECPKTDPDLASQPTFSRLENGVNGVDVRHLHNLLVEDYLNRRVERPKQIVLDVDVTDDPEIPKAYPKSRSITQSPPFINNRGNSSLLYYKCSNSQPCDCEVWQPSVMNGPLLGHSGEQDMNRTRG